jgi:hypothetical protein
VPEVIEDHDQLMTFSIYLQFITFGGAGGFVAATADAAFLHRAVLPILIDPGTLGGRCATAQPHVADLNGPHLRPDHAT